MPVHINKEGNRYGRLTVVLRLGRTEGNGTYRYLVQCDCGESKTVGTGALSRGQTQSCGCLQRRRGAESPNFKHGLADKSHPLNRKYQRETFDRFKYGLEPDHKQALMDKQNGGCAICGYKFGQKKGDIKVDHCHNQGHVRGLLCDLCNRGIGMLKENTEILSNAIKYIQQSALAR